MANLIGKELQMFRGALSNVLADESYTIPTEEAKCCLLIAQKLVSVLDEPSTICTEFSEKFSSWLVGELKKIVKKSIKRNGLINPEKLWSMYHECTSSSAFRLKWEEFLAMAQQPLEPLLYQHVTDMIFEAAVKEVVAPEEVTNEPAEYSEAFTFEEENAVRYVGGFVIHCLQKSKTNKSISGILQEFIESDATQKTDGPAQEWTNAVDRGGLTRITTEAYQIFYAVEACVRRYLKVSKVTDMNENFRKHLSDSILNDADVLFYWCQAGHSEDDEASCKCLEKIIEKWITIRGFSFAGNLMEIYKQEQKKGTEKSKSLRTQLFK